MASRARSRRQPRNRRRKNLILDQTRIDRARALLGASTETETIHLALDAVADLAAFRAELDHGFELLLGQGGFVNRFRGRT